MLGCIFFSIEGIIGYTDQMFRAAVYEHAPLSPKRTIVVTRQEALDYMRKNLEVYRTATEDAQRQVSCICITYVLFIYDSIVR